MLHMLMRFQSLESTKMTRSRGRPKGSLNRMKNENSLEANDQKKIEIEDASSDSMIDLTQSDNIFKKPTEVSQQSNSDDLITID